MLPQPDSVSAVDLTAGGTPLDKDKIKFTPASKVPGYRCAVLILVDKTVGNGQGTTKDNQQKLWRSVRETVGKLTKDPETPPYQFEVATYSAGQVRVLAPLGSKRSVLDSAIETLNFAGANAESPLFYMGTKNAVELFSATAADRKFLVVISDGISKDNQVFQPQLVQAALQAKVHVCTIGFPTSAEARDAVQKLSPLAELTGGYSLRAEGADPRLSADAETNLLNFMVSGGRAEINLGGLVAPVNLEFKVQAGSTKVYTFPYKVESLPAPTPVSAPTPASTPTPAPKPPPSTAEVLKARISEHPVVTVATGLALLAALLLVLTYFLRRGRKSVPSFDTTQRIEPVTTVLKEPTSVTPALAWLVSMDADQTRHPITKSAVRIGRKPDNDIVMKNDSVSSHHAEIFKRGDKFIITDLDSSNSVFVGGNRVEKTALQNGDIIELGEVRLRFQTDSPDH